MFTPSPLRPTPPLPTLTPKSSNFCFSSFTVNCCERNSWNGTFTLDFLNTSITTLALRKFCNIAGDDLPSPNSGKRPLFLQNSYAPSPSFEFRSTTIPWLVIARASENADLCSGSLDISGYSFDTSAIAASTLLVYQSAALVSGLFSLAATISAAITRAIISSVSGLLEVIGSFNISRARLCNIRAASAMFLPASLFFPSLPTALSFSGNSGLNVLLYRMSIEDNLRIPSSKLNLLETASFSWDRAMFEMSWTRSILIDSSLNNSPCVGFWNLVGKTVALLGPLTSTALPNSGNSDINPLFFTMLL